MKRSSILIMILMITIRFAMAQPSENLVRNGTFEKGNVGFKSDYQFDNTFDRLADSINFLGGAGTYNVIEHDASYYGYFSSQRGTTWSPRAIYPKGLSTGFFLAVDVNVLLYDGTPLLDINPLKFKRLWYASITIKPNTTYSFSCILANMCYEDGSPLAMKYVHPGSIKLCVNGNKVSKWLNLPYSNEWRALSGKFTSGPDQTKIEISIEDQGMGRGVNWVAVDNIVFKEIQLGEYEKEFAKKEEPVAETPPIKEKETVIEISSVKEEKSVVKIPPAVLKEEVEKELPPPTEVKGKTEIKAPKLSRTVPNQVVVKKKEEIPLIIKKEVPVTEKPEPVKPKVFSSGIKISDVMVDEALELSHIYFEKSKSHLLPASIPELKDLTEFMKKNPTVRIRLEGHTESGGDPKKNLALSENRVKEVKKYLVEQGIDDNRIEWIGYGGQRPMNNNSTEYFREKNRRVEVVIIGK